MTEEVVPIPPEGTPKEDQTGAWAFWYLIPYRPGVSANKGDDWHANLHPLHSFDTTEDFLRIINSVEHPSKLLQGCHYYVFRSFSKPLWEHETVSNGYIISIEMEKDKIQPTEISLKWMKLVQEVLEDTSADNLSILGTEYNSKQTSWKISLWVSRGCTDIEDIRKKMEVITGLAPARISEVMPVNI